MYCNNLCKSIYKGNILGLSSLLKIIGDNSVLACILNFVIIPQIHEIFKLMSPLKIIKINYNQVDSEKVTMLLILFHNISTEFKVHCQL